MLRSWNGFRPCAALVCLVLTTIAARPADYPSRTIRVVVPFAAAGVTDIVARVVFQHIAETTGKTIIVDGSLPANVTLYPDLNYNPLHDLAPIAIFGVTGAVLLVNNQLPVKTAQEFVAYAKSKPGELTFASTGIGTPGHLNGELFDRLAGIQAVHVPAWLARR